MKTTSLAGTDARSVVGRKRVGVTNVEIALPGGLAARGYQLGRHVDVPANAIRPQMEYLSPDIRLVLLYPVQKPVSSSGRLVRP
jgi:hypothetical protein